MASVYQDPKREIELILCNILTERVQVDFFPHKRDDERETPYGVVLCEVARPLVGGRAPRGYLCDVKVVYVSHMDETESESHAQNCAKVEDVLSLIPQLDIEEYLLRENHIKIAGLSIRELQEASREQSVGDIFVCTVGAIGVDCPVTTNLCDSIRMRRPSS